MFQTNGDNHVQRPYYCICQKFGCNGNDPKRSVKIRFHNPHNYVHQSYHCIHNRNWAAHAWRLPCTKTHSIARLLIYYWPTGSNDAPGLLFWQSAINVDDLSLALHTYTFHLSFCWQQTTRWRWQRGEFPGSQFLRNHSCSDNSFALNKNINTVSKAFQGLGFFINLYEFLDNYFHRESPKLAL